MSIKSFASIFLFAAVVLGTESVWADGCFFPTPASGEQAPVDVDAQMAIIKISSSGEWDLYLRASYSGDPAAFGWVIPFPVLPDVDPDPVDDRFFKDMDEYTATWFFQESCYEECGSSSGGCAPFAKTGGDSLSNGELDPSKVTVWESGKIGVLEYAIISSAGGDSLVSWLEENDFVILPRAEPIIAELAAEGSYFFAAKIDPGVEDVRRLKPIRFMLPADVEPFYPMRLTAASSTEKIKVLLWIVDEEGRSRVPSNYAWDFISGAGSLGDELTAERYDERKEAILTAGQGNTFLIQFSTDSRQSRDCYFHEHYVQGCEFYPESPEMQSIMEYYYDTSWGITRMYAEIPPDKLTLDIAFEIAGASRLGEVVGWYWQTCDEKVVEQCSCSVAGSGVRSGLPPAAPLLILLVIAAAVLAARRRRG
ncbi:MAG: DUF2330 domain-containing protein [Pseudomonadota bacterium]